MGSEPLGSAARAPHRVATDGHASADWRLAGLSELGLCPLGLCDTEKVNDSAEKSDGKRLVRANGCVVWRRSKSGELEFLVVHRPRYDDWSFAKGKLDPGETDEACARREVLEETGLAVELGDELPLVEYVDHRDRPKRVRYWLASIIDGSFVANDEVDAAEWLTVGPAADRLTYPHDGALLDEANRRLG